MKFDLVPMPAKIENRAGFFNVNRETSIVCGPAGASAGELLANAMRPATGFGLPVVSAGSPLASNLIELRIEDDAPAGGTEGYRLSVTPGRVLVTAPATAGLLYGTQTLLQMLPGEIVSRHRVPKMDPPPADVVLHAGQRAPAWEIPCAEIDDAPRFAWRGLMIDCSRHFMPADTLKWCMDKMLQLKMNRLHLHLSDNHGWRIEIPGWPALTEIGSRVEPEPERHGFYTRADIKALCEYAAQRNIVIVPEIDIPGHTFAAITSYPDLCCTGKPRRNDLSQWHQPDILCAGRNSTLDFLDAVFGTLMDLFPGPYVHVGGDEAPKVRWRQCPHCQERIRQEKLRDEHALQSWLIGRVSAGIRKAGRRVIAWEDVLAGEPDSDVIIHWWRGRQHGVAAPLEAWRRGHEIICSANTWSYYFAWENLLERFYRDARYLPVEFNAMQHIENGGPAAEPPGWRKIIGAQGCMWTECTPPHMLAARLFPAILANAELQWNYRPPERRDWPAFERRARALRGHFEGCNVLNWGS